MGELCNIFPEEFIVLPVQVLQYNNGACCDGQKLKYVLYVSLYISFTVMCRWILRLKTTVFLRSVFCIKNAKVFWKP